MDAVPRQYSGAAAGVIDAIIPRQGEVEEILRGVPGFVAYYAVKSSDGGTTITVCETREGTQETTRRAADWVRANLTAAAGSPPAVTEGEVVMNFAGGLPAAGD
jgi:hypothetical protein